MSARARLALASLWLAGCTGVVSSPAASVAEQGCTPGQPGPRLLRRLSRAELATTLRAGLGVDSPHAKALAADVLVHGFDNAAAALTVTALQADQLRLAAEEVAAGAAPALGCDGDGTGCARAYLQGPARRLFRRPLSAAEVDRWLAVYQVGAATAPAGTPAHRSGMELLLTGLLQSPHFLYRAELGEPDGAGGYRLSSFEVATELAYLLTGGPPDDALWALAEADGLKDSAAVAAQARRLLASPAARGALDRFVAQWLTVDQLAVVPKDATAYPELTDATRAAMAEELFRRHAAAVQSGASLATLLTSHTTYLDASLARLYGLPAPPEADGGGFGPVDSHGGLLGSGAVMTAHAHPDGTLPVTRGRMVREQLLCQPLPPPPSGVVAQPPAPDPTLTTRQRFAAHATDPACQSCHRLMDPIGFGFERFDGIGRYREAESGQPIDDSGAIEGEGVAFQGLDGLSTALAASPKVAACHALLWARFAYAAPETPRTACLLAEAKGLAADGGTLLDLVVGLTGTRHFLARVADDGHAVAADAGAPDAGPGTSAAPDAGAASPGVAVEVATTTSWPTGRCGTVTVTNGTARSVTWQVAVDLPGTLYTSWNFTILSRDGTRYLLAGVPFNATLAPGGAAQGGFCVNL